MEEGGQNGASHIPVTTKQDFSINDIAPAKPADPQPTSTSQPGPVSPFPGSDSPGLKSNLDTPTVAKQPKKFKISKKVMTLVLSILVVLIFIGGLYGVYNWQHGKLSALNAQVTNLKFQNETYQQIINKDKAELAEPVATPSTTSSHSTSSTQAATNSQYTFKITQLGVQLTLPASLADVTDQANSGNTLVNLSTGNLGNLDSACSANATKGEALGDISKATGQFAAKTGVTLVKQFSTYYITYTAPTTNCSTVTQVNTLVGDLQTALKSSFSSIKEITQ